VPAGVAVLFGSRSTEITPPTTVYVRCQRCTVLPSAVVMAGESMVIRPANRTPLKPVKMVSRIWVGVALAAAQTISKRRRKRFMTAPLRYASSRSSI
jgi:hypothetical protein